MVSPLAVVAFCLVSYTLSNVGPPVSHYHNHSHPGSSSSNACMTMDHFAYQPPSWTLLGFHSHYPPHSGSTCSDDPVPHLFPLLQELSFHFYSYIRSIISSIPSNSVTLIHLHGLEDSIGTTYNSCWGMPLDHFESRLGAVIYDDLPEYGALGVSIRTIAQRYSSRHRGLKTRVQVSYQPACRETQAFKDGEVPFCMTKLEEANERG